MDFEGLQSLEEYPGLYNMAYALLFVFLFLLATTWPINCRLGPEWSLFDTGSDGSFSPTYPDSVAGDQANLPNGEIGDGQFNSDIVTNEEEPSPLLFDNQRLDPLTINKEDSNPLLVDEWLSSPDASDGGLWVSSTVADNSDCDLDADLEFNKREAFCPTPLNSDEKTQTGNEPPGAIPDPGKVMSNPKDLERWLRRLDAQKNSDLWVEYTPSYDDEDMLCGVGVFTVCDSGFPWDRLPTTPPYYTLRAATESM